MTDAVKRFHGNVRIGREWHVACDWLKDGAPQSLQAPPQYPALGDSYRFSPPAPTSTRHSRAFYRVDDVIQTYFSNSTVWGLLRQPSPGTAAAFCMNSNPAKFLRSASLSCSRMLTPQSCSTDPHLNARSYFSDMSLIKIPVTPLADWPAPSELNDSCINVVTNVEFVVGYTGRGEVTYATVNVVLADVDPNQLLLQTHSVKFQIRLEKYLSRRFCRMEASLRKVRAAMSSTLLNLGGVKTQRAQSQKSRDAVAVTSSPLSSLRLAASKPSFSDGTHTSFLADQSACATPLWRRSLSLKRNLPSAAGGSAMSEGSGRGSSGSTDGGSEAVELTGAASGGTMGVGLTSDLALTSGLWIETGDEKS
ncbi:Tectonic-3 [Liparis tanakae]|uniref:Tectonic-3 n=1 Tax=Liparis tanakae TaxID=230148 RepID=A0A4Z2FP92_9TELE|nr:Tectonic-3 [Liparis tanakae]